MQWYEITQKALEEELGVSTDRGLSQAEANRRQEAEGKNEFAPPKKESLGKKVLHHLADVSTIVLILAFVLSLALALRSGHGFVEPIVIIAIVIMNLILAITQEGKAERALDALADMNSPTCTVLRDGQEMEIDTKDLVRGDVILLSTGAYIPADARLIESTNLEVDESALTGESEGSEKDAAAALTGKVALGDQANMVFSGCLVVAGHGVAIVTEIGMDTEMGHIAGHLNRTQPGKTPLQKRLNRVGKTISAIALAAAIVLFLVGLFQGEDFWSMILLAVSLAVAAVPETLNLIVTLALSNGVNKMVGKNALVRKLPVVETLGNTSVICSDKTGTLTQNRMDIQRLYLEKWGDFKAKDEFADEQMAFLYMLALASNATCTIGEDGTADCRGNATEVAIMRLLVEKGGSMEKANARFKKVAEIPFSSDRKMMTVVLEDVDGGYVVVSKGAIDRLPFERSLDGHYQHVVEVHDGFARDALRVIALGARHIDELPPEGELESVEKDLRLVGLIGLIDPPRPEAKEAIAVAKSAGIRTIMITGDHAATAKAIAKEIGILEPGQKVITGAQLAEIPEDEFRARVGEFSVYARVSPEDKIRIVEAWQSRGEVVAMTGDGVNDAPALKAADVGIAMGEAGTEVAKSAADMVLTDDNFATIVEAVHEGRNVYSNIRKTIYFLLCCNISEIIVMLMAQIAGWGIIVTPVMLLLINVLGDGIPGLHLAREESDPRIMENPPVPREQSFFAGGLSRVIGVQTAAMSVVTLIGYYFTYFRSVGGVEGTHAMAQTVAFLVIGFTSILHIFTVRSRQSIFRRTLRDNVPLVVSAMAMIALFALMVLIAPLGSVFGLVPISGAHWLLVIGLSVVPTIVAEVRKLYDNRKPSEKDYKSQRELAA